MSSWTREPFVFVVEPTPIHDSREFFAQGDSGQLAFYRKTSLDFPLVSLGAR